VTEVGGSTGGAARAPTPVQDLGREWWRWFLALGPAGSALIASSAILLLSFADVHVGPGVDLTLLYLVPVGFGTFFGGFGVGAGLSILASVSGLVTSRYLGGPHSPALAAWNAAQQMGVFLVLAGVLDALHRRLLHEKQAARTDALTDLANRRAFVEAAWAELERARRHGRPLSLLYLDCDDFKGVNDRLGHVVGDRVLSVVGATLREGVRGHDTVARLGGDEFGVLLPEIDGAGATALAERLRARLGEALSRHDLPVTLSMGVATFASPPASVDEMILRADELMYEAKRSGKDRWCSGVWGEVGHAA
jgi:diguanylate cyclase (GGDEF)-like protein